MTRRLFLIGVIGLLLLCRCSAPEHRVILVFPDQTLMDATSKVTLTVHAALADPCA